MGPYTSPHMTLTRSTSGLEEALTRFKCSTGGNREGIMEGWAAIYIGCDYSLVTGLSGSPDELDLDQAQVWTS